MPAMLITGAASGLGKHLAQEARTRGYDLYLVDVSPMVAEVAAETSARYLVADLIERATFDRIASWAPDIDVLINNAGIATKAPFHEMDLASAEGTVLVNVRAPVILSRIYLERFRHRGSGTIVNISSSAGYFPTPELAPYGASKAFLTAFTEALIAESWDNPNIRILGICPSGMATNFQEVSGVRREHARLLLDPRWVARRIMDDLAHGHSGVRNYGVTTHLFKAVCRFLPRRLYLRAFTFLLRRYR